MIQASLAAQVQYLDASRSRDPGHLHGQFVPWALLKISDRVRAFKLARGTLLVSNAQRASFYSIERAELQQTIQVDIREVLRHADASERHLFIVSAFQLTVYDRASGSRILTIPAGRLPWDYYASPENQWRYTEGTPDNYEPSFQQATSPNSDVREDHFRAGVWSKILGTAVIPI